MKIRIRIATSLVTLITAVAIAIYFSLHRIIDIDARVPSHAGQETERQI